MRGFLAGVPLLPPSLPLPFRTPATQANATVSAQGKIGLKNTS